MLLDGGEPAPREHFSLGYDEYVWTRDDRYALVSLNDGTEAKLYDLIFKRAMASQMAAASLERTTVTLRDGTGRDTRPPPPPNLRPRDDRREPCCGSSHRSGAGGGLLSGRGPGDARSPPRRIGTGHGQASTCYNSMVPHDPDTGFRYR